MFAHVTVGALEIELSRKFYDATFVEFGIRPGVTEDRWLVYNSGNCVFAVGLPFDGNPARCANGVTIGLTASRKNAVDAWHAAGLRNGGSCEGEPGIRNEGRSYVAYLRDPVGNKLCAKFDFESYVYKSERAS